MPFDHEQTQAINALGRNILVSASAGAGKTGVLVARLKKRCVDDRVPLSAILAMTFTQAAAAEMKKRLARELNSLYAKAEDEDEKAWLQAQLIALQSAHITTIDSYCLSIIQKYANVLGKDPAITRNILSEGTQRQYKNEAFRKALSAMSALYPEQTLRMIEMFSLRPEDYKSLYDIVERINNAAQAQIDPDAWYEQARNLWKPVSCFDDFDPELLDAFYSSLTLRLESFQTRLADMRLAAADDPKVKPETLTAKENAVNNCLNALKEKNYSRYCTALENLVLVPTSPSTKNERYTKIRTRLSDGIKDLLAVRYEKDVFIKDHNDLSPYMMELIDLARMTWQLFMAKKEEETAMDFADMERFAWNILLSSDSFVAKLIADGFEEIMVDEFQDTSYLQNAIIEKISRGNNVFRVGDVKQSIYRFRQARPDLMRGLMKDEDTIRITLRHNYRSKKSIVAFTNLLFGRLMNVEGCRDTYDDNDKVSIGAPHQEEDHDVPVIFDLFVGDDPEYTNKERKAYAIAGRILKMMKEDETLSFRSFCVLVKAHNDKIPLRQAFDLYGIPYEIDAREGFYSSQLCRVFLAMIRFMLDPEDAISLTAVLTSAFYGFADEELALLKIRHGSILKGGTEEHPEIPEEFHELRMISETQGILPLFAEIARRHDFFSRLDDKQQANFDYLFDQVMHSDIADLHSLLNMMEAGEDEKSSEASASGSDDDVVTVTTIHQSKGLQYPVVFLWSSSLNAFQDARNAVFVHEHIVSAKHITFPWLLRHNTIEQMAASFLASNEDLEEYIRLLYVAVTRAEKRLFIVDRVREEPLVRPINAALLNDRKGFTSLILSALPDCSLFHREYPEIELPQGAQKRKKTYADSLPKLTVPVRVFPRLETPSENEVTSLPDLDLSQQNRSGRRYGTEMHAILAELPDIVWSEEDLVKTGLPPWDRQRLMAFGNSALYQSCLKYEIHKEYPFYVETDSFRMSGTMDFVAIGDDEIILIDFKTDHAEPEDIIERYSGQLNAYRRALHILYPDRPVKAYAWSLHSNAAILIEEEEEEE